MEKLQEMYRGKAKKVFCTDDKDLLWLEYTDDITAGDGDKKSQQQNKGKLNNQISALLFFYLQKRGIEGHFVELISPKEMLVKRVNILPVEVVVRNIAAGVFAGV